MTNRELEILHIIEENPLISQEEIAFMLGITRSGVAAHIHNLMKKGYIKGKGYVLNERNFISVIGGINIDIVGRPSDRLITNNSNPGTINFTLGGAGRNISLALTKMNVPNYLISVFGDDLNGDKFIHDSKLNGMDISCCEQLQGERTSSYLYIDYSDGSKTTGIDDMNIYQKLTPTFITKYLDKINHSQYCIIDTNLPKQTIRYLYEQVKVPIIIKTISMNKNHRLINANQKIELLVTTPNELNELVQRYHKKSIDIPAAINFLHTKNIKEIVVFSIKSGLYYSGRQGQQQLYVPPKSINNTSGTMAVLTATIVWGLHKNLSWKKIIPFAYDAVLLSVQSELPVNPELSLNKLLTKP